MPLADPIVLLAGLVEIALPARTVRLADGGFVRWGVDTYPGEDPDFGTVGSVASVGEAVADEAPAGRLTLLPPESASAAALFQAEAQGSAIRFWLAEVDRATASVTGSPELLFDGMVDQLTLRLDKGERSVDIDFVAAAERLFHVREGNALNSRFHQLAWPGELGFDHATGMQRAVPWGISGPPRGTDFWSGSSSGGSSGNLVGGIIRNL